MREADTSLLHCPSPRPVQDHEERCPLSLQFLQWERRSHKGQPVPLVLWITLQKPLLWFHTTRIAGESAGHNHWESDYDRDIERGLQQPAHESWQTEFLPVVRSSNPNQRFCLFCRTKSEDMPWLSNSVVCPSQILKQWVLLNLEPGLPIPRQKAESQPHPLWGVSSVPFDQKG